MKLTLADPSVKRCPFRTQDLIREKSPAYLDPVTGFYVVSHYDDVKKLANDMEKLSNSTGVLITREGPNSEAANKLFAERGYLPMDTLNTCDPPDHGLYRGLVDKAFTPRRVAAMMDYIGGLAKELVDGFIDKGEVEFISEFAVKLPTIIIADQLGFPREDAKLFNAWSDATIEMIDPTLDLQRELQLTESIIDMQNYIVRKAERIRHQREDNILSDLVHAEIEGRKLNDRELCAILQIVLVAGNETTTSALGSAMILLIENPGLTERLFAQPDLIPTFVEEVLRLRAPTQGVLRRAKIDFDIRGAKIPKGALVHLMVGSANYDPAVFPDPYTVNLERPNGKAHLSFGTGKHFCIGAALARKEMLISLTEIVTRMKSMRYAKGENSTKFIEAYTYGPLCVELAFDRRQ